MGTMMLTDGRRMSDLKHDYEWCIVKCGTEYDVGDRVIVDMGVGHAVTVVVSDKKALSDDVVQYRGVDVCKVPIEWLEDYE